MKISKLLIEIIAILIIILWIYTGLNKMLDYSTFKSQLGRSPFIQPMAGLIAITLPSIELLFAGLLVFKRTRKFGLYLSFGLMLLFTGYIWLMLNYAYDLPCSCGGVLAKLSWSDHLVFNSGYTILSLIGIILIERMPKQIAQKEKQFSIPSHIK